MLESTLISAEECLTKSHNIGSNEYCDNNIFFAENNDPREQILWNVNKNRIDFYKYDNDCNNQLLSCFNFEEIYSDPTLVISFVIRCVDRFQEPHNSSHSFKVIVTLNSGDGSSVVIIDIIAGCVLSTIAFPYTICSIEIVSGGKESNFNRPFGEAIQPLDGILAVGTVGGNVFLLDLRLDSLPEDPLISSQVTFSNIHKATMKDVTLKRAAAVQHQQNLAFMMNSFAKTKNHFVYMHADKKNVYNRFATQSVYVSCLYYIPTNCSLAIGFNFGGLQMISLQQGFQLELSHELKSELPVIAFAHQLPESDPKNFIYFWVVRGMHQKSLGLENTGQCSLCSRAYLFRALYDKRTDTNFGISYSNFIQYEMVFYFPLVYNIKDQESKSITSSKLLEIFPISKYFTADGLQSIDNRYTVILWTAEATNSNNRETYFVIFDLNQWYLYFDFQCKDAVNSAFLTVYSLRSVNGLISNQDRIQALNFQTDSIRKFLFKRFNPLETDNVNNSPSSLSFNVMISSQEKLFLVKFWSVQKRTLNDVFNKSTSVLSKPMDSVMKLSRCGLISQESLPSISPSLNQLDILFNLALNYSQMSFFRKIITKDDYGSDVLDWLTREIIQTKKNIDDNSMSLFDYSGSSFSPEQQRILNSCECNLRYMMIILKFFEQLKQKQKNYQEIFHDKVKALNEVIDLMHSFLKIIFNLHHVNILPERLPQNCYSGQTYYDFDIMRSSYESERRNVISLCSTAFPDPNKVLLIDLIVQYFEDSLKDAWKLDDDIVNNDSGPLYPPKNLHCLCRTFLLENETIPKLFREFILIYFLIDYCRMNHNDQEYLNTILPFFRSNIMDCKMQDLVLGVWHADHGNYDIALSFLCSSNTLKAFKDFRSLQTELFSEILDRIVELFIFHDRTKQALNFIEISEIFPYDTINEILYIYLLVCDQKLLSAIDFQRRRRVDNTSELFEKFLEFCNQKNCLHKLCFIDLDEYEELLFLTYLYECEQQSKRLLLVFYYLSKNLFVEALNFVQNNQVDFSELPEMLELLKSYENIVPLNELNTIAKGMELLQTKYNHDDQDGLKFDANQPLIKVHPKKCSRIIFTKSHTIEQALIAKELADKQLFDPMKSFNTSIRASFSNTPVHSRKSFALTPKRSSITKAKVRFSSKKKKNPFSSLLQTPDVKRQILADLSTQSYNRPPSVLKRLINDSESVHSSDSSKLKVNVKFKLPKLTAISPVQEDRVPIAFLDRSSIEKSMEVDDIETNETLNSSAESLEKNSSQNSREFELRETPPLCVNFMNLQNNLESTSFVPIDSDNTIGKISEKSSTTAKKVSGSLLKDNVAEEPPEKKARKKIITKRTKTVKDVENISESTSNLPIDSDNTKEKVSEPSSNIPKKSSSSSLNEESAEHPPETKVKKMTITKKPRTPKTPRTTKKNLQSTEHVPTVSGDTIEKLSKKVKANAAINSGTSLKDEVTQQTSDESATKIKVTKRARTPKSVKKNLEAIIDTVDTLDKIAAKVSKSPAKLSGSPAKDGLVQQTPDKKAAKVKATRAKTPKSAKKNLEATDFAAIDSVDIIDKASTSPAKLSGSSLKDEAAEETPNKKATKKLIIKRARTPKITKKNLEPAKPIDTVDTIEKSSKKGSTSTAKNSDSSLKDEQGEQTPDKKAKKKIVIKRTKTPERPIVFERARSSERLRAKSVEKSTPRYKF